MTSHDTPQPTHDDDARLGGTEDAAVDDRAEELRDAGIMPDVAAMRHDDREHERD